uniref:Uncharacterized protein n=1 Tax=Glossina morsitans morsitans TaxID=37546 RepID=A0A1B0G2P3_GLOMM
MQSNSGGLVAAAATNAHMAASVEQTLNLTRFC